VPAVAQQLSKAYAGGEIAVESNRYKPFISPPLHDVNLLDIQMVKKRPIT
jgi:hypothetical protein